MLDTSPANLPIGNATARRLATSTIAGEKSVEMTRPPSPTSGAAANPVLPGPAASSSTTSPCCGARAAMSHSRIGAETASISSALRSHPGAIASQVS